MCSIKKILSVALKDMQRHDLGFLSNVSGPNDIRHFYINEY